MLGVVDGGVRSLGGPRARLGLSQSSQGCVRAMGILLGGALRQKCGHALRRGMLEERWAAGGCLCSQSSQGWCLDHSSAPIP